MAAAATPSMATTGQGGGCPACTLHPVAASAGAATTAARTMSDQRAAASLGMAGDQRQPDPGRAPAGEVVDVDRAAEQREPRLHRRPELPQLAAGRRGTGDPQLEAVGSGTQRPVDL